MISSVHDEISMRT